MEDLINNLSTKLTTSTSLFDDMIKVELDNNYLYDKVYEMINHSMQVDGVPIKKKEGHQY